MTQGFIATCPGCSLARSLLLPGHGQGAGANSINLCTRRPHFIRVCPSVHPRLGQSAPSADVHRHARALRWSQARPCAPGCAREAPPSGISCKKPLGASALRLSAAHGSVVTSKLAARSDTRTCGRKAAAPAKSARWRSGLRRLAAFGSGNFHSAVPSNPNMPFNFGTSQISKSGKCCESKASMLRID